RIVVAVIPAKAGIHLDFRETTQSNLDSGFGRNDDEKENEVMSKVLIIAEHLDGKLNASTARCVTCAKDFKAESIDVLVLAADVAAIAADAAKIDGVAKVLTVARAENAHALAATYAPQVTAVAKNGYTHVLFPSTTFGKDVAPRVAALLGV